MDHNPYPAYYPQQQQQQQYPLRASYGPLHLNVSTDTSPHEHDPNERTARPGNAHHHAQFHAQTLPQPSSLLQYNHHHHQPPIVHIDDDMLTTDPIATQDPPPPADSSYTTSTPGLSGGLTRPLKPQEQERLAHLDRLKFFLATAPSRWDTPSSSTTNTTTAATDPSSSSASNTAAIDGGPAHLQHHQHHPHHNPSSHSALNRFLLPSQEYVSCVLWNGLYHITGTDIVRALVFRFEAFGRPVQHMKKFEEGVFSDLRNLKPGVDACLEEPKSPFLDLLFKFQCIRTQKKQKVFYWFSVPHDRLFLDALERDLKREKMGQEPTTKILGEPALSFTYDPKRSLYEQFSKAQGAREGEGELEAAVRIVEEGGSTSTSASMAAAAAGSASEMDAAMMGLGGGTGGSGGTGSEGDSEHGGMMTGEDSEVSDADEVMGNASSRDDNRRRSLPPALQGTIGLGSSWISGNPTYKLRKKKGPKNGSVGGGLGVGVSGHHGHHLGASAAGDDHRGRSEIGGGGDHRRYGSLSLSRERMMGDGFGLGMGTSSSISPNVSAADMFNMQARGELDHSAAGGAAGGSMRKPPSSLSSTTSTATGGGMSGDVGVYYSEPQTQAQRFLSGGGPVGLGATGAAPGGGVIGGHQRGRSYEQMHRHTYPLAAPPATADPTSGYGPGSFPQHHQQHHQQQQHHHPLSHSQSLDSSSSSSNNNNGNSADPSSSSSGMLTKTKAFVCPLFSCGRMFKRMEHLKRHLRTHTMERPYMCPQCKKKFSRSDNLNQHLRTHGRVVGVNGVVSAPPAMGVGANNSGGGGGVVGMGAVVGGGNAAAVAAAAGGVGMVGADVGALGLSDWMSGGDAGDDGDRSGGSGGSSVDGHVVRTGMDGGEAGNGGSGGGGGVESDYEDFDGEEMSRFSANVHQLGLGMFGHTALGMGMADFNASALGGPAGGVGVGGVGGYGADIDPQICEVEIQGDLRDVSGDEEGLIMRADGSGHHHHHQQTFGQELYYSTTAANSYASSSGLDGNNNHNSGAQQQGGSDFDANWVVRGAGNGGGGGGGGGGGAQPSPVFSHISVPSPPHIRSNRSSLTSAPSGYRSASSSSVASSVYGGDDYVTSLSAPSHKQAFDHAALYPPGVLDANSTPPHTAGPGPIRRHRSMTPSVMRNGEPIRRPMTAGSTGDYQSGHESPGSSTGGGGGGGGRGYHPYSAAYGSSSSRAGSTHSSPSAFSIPLAGEYSQQNMRRSESRNSSISGMQEQMRQMMNMSLDGGPGQQQQQQQHSHPSSYRTDSPFIQTDSPAAFTTDLPPQFGAEHQQQYQAAGSAYALDGQIQDQSQFVLQGMDEDSYYPHPQHATL